jgi:AraC family transcriptional regulator, regulatory protein of adaptative response / DNA-3-methyladenine glycosylase II
MRFDRQTCSQARLTRDARFDGRFFIGVRSTRIYCRTICPVRAAKEVNITYFPTAAAAAEAGYRPCLRCRPESSPGTPAWSGTSTTVARALRLISEGGVEDEGVEQLAARLGLGSRQLRRLFIQHLGATPSAVIKTRRLHFAKKLIDETRLHFGEIARVSGFGSVRRFNNAFRKTYSRTPTQIRRLAPSESHQSKDRYRFQVHFRPPLHWPALLDFLARRAIPGVEAVESDRYLRTIAFNGSSGSLSVALPQDSSSLCVDISFPDPRWLFQIIERVRHIFDLTADPRDIAAHLSGDPFLAARVEAMPGLRVPGCWDGFELAVRAILGQQISVAGASTLAGRLAQTFGTRVSDNTPLTHLFPKPEQLAEANIAGIGLPSARAETIRALARQAADGRITFDATQDSDDFRSRLCEIPGVGDWTAQYIAMRALGDPDAFPANDLGLIRATSLQTARDICQRAEQWRPWRAYAAMYLWQINGGPTVREGPVAKVALADARASDTIAL